MNASNLRALAAIVLFVAVQEVSVARARVASGAAQPEAREKGRLVLTHTLPQLDGNYLKATVVQVHYGPGELSPQHSHPCSVISYVVQGTYRTQVEGDPEAVYKSVRHCKKPRTAITWFQPTPARRNRRGSSPSSSAIKTAHSPQTFREASTGRGYHNEEIRGARIRNWVGKQPR
jgi:hypothetical protein